MTVVNPKPLMSFFSRAATTALTGLAIFGFASAAFARPITSDHGKHEALVESIVDAGVRLYVNPDVCNEDDVMGWYQGMAPMMVICQENRGKVTGEQVEWTEEDYDTLRHEAQHLIQDCKDGRIDHELEAMVEDVVPWSASILGIDALERIYASYSRAGASEQVILLEFEAFAAAALNVPEMQAEAVELLCSLRSQSTTSPKGVK